MTWGCWRVNAAHAWFPYLQQSKRSADELCGRTDGNTKVIFPKEGSNTAPINVGDYVLVKVGFDSFIKFLWTTKTALYHVFGLNGPTIEPACFHPLVSFNEIQWTGPRVLCFERNYQRLSPFKLESDDCNHKMWNPHPFNPHSRESLGSSLCFLKACTCLAMNVTFSTVSADNNEMKWKICSKIWTHF